MKKYKRLILIVFIALLALIVLGCEEKPTEEKIQTVATPTFSPPGGSYDTAQTVSISCATSGATIRYTTDGLDPTSSSEVYSNRINVDRDTILKARAFKSGWDDSTIAKAEYSILSSRIVATPIFSPPGGSYNTAHVIISCATDGATIRYTTNGSDPTYSSAVYSDPIYVSQNITLKAKAFKLGWDESSVATATYTMAAATPTFSPPGGTYNTAQTVSISCETEGATIRYTTNGSDPTSYSTVYSDPINVSQNTTLKAKAFHTDLDGSAIAKAEYSITKVVTPTFSPPGGYYDAAQKVSISCETEGATIRYTANGSDPTSSSTLYSSPIDVSKDTTLKAKAFKSGWDDSSIATATYSMIAATPTFSPPGGFYDNAQRVSISCETDGATIRYTIDGEDPTSSSTLYSSPIDVSKDTTLKAKAFKSGLDDSFVASSSYYISKIEMIHVPGGTFTMGRTKGDGYNDELPTHSVTLNSFYIGKYQVTQREYEAIMGSNPSSAYGVGDNYPVYYVSWYSAIKFCNLLSMMQGLTPVYSISDSTDPDDWGNPGSTWDAAICNWNANGYRLPTEAEWEYAARGGTNNPDYLYSGSDNIDEVAWYWENNSPYGTKPVGGKAPNGLGIYDMSGNLWEWCWDWYDSSYYSSCPSSNPRGPSSGSYRLRRGGYWDYDADYCRVAYRNDNDPYYSYDTIGFRLCRTFP